VTSCAQALGAIWPNLLSSTSRYVCELWDGQKVVRLEATDPLTQELIYVGEDGKAGEEWDTLSEAIDEGILMKKKRHGDRDVDVEKQQRPEPKDRSEPPNILLNLIADSRSRELRAGAILGGLLQKTVLIVAGLTTFDPHIKHQFPVLLYEFCCMAA
jgi:hypothetical protein